MNKNTEGKKIKKENKTDVLINFTFAISTITSVDKFLSRINCKYSREIKQIIIFIYKKSW